MCGFPYSKYKRKKALTLGMRPPGLISFSFSTNPLENFLLLLSLLDFHLSSSLPQLSAILLWTDNICSVCVPRAAVHTSLWGGLMGDIRAQPDGVEDPNSELKAATGYIAVILRGIHRTTRDTSHKWGMLLSESKLSHFALDFQASRLHWLSYSLAYLWSEQKNTWSPLDNMLCKNGQHWCQLSFTSKIPKCPNMFPSYQSSSSVS